MIGLIAWKAPWFELLEGVAMLTVAALKELTNLQTLDLAGNQIADVGPLAGLTNLQYLELSRNQVASAALRCSTSAEVRCSPVSAMTRAWWYAGRLTKS